jgi:hypothetical protein
VAADAKLYDFIKVLYLMIRVLSTHPRPCAPSAAAGQLYHAVRPMSAASDGPAEWASFTRPGCLVSQIGVWIWSFFRAAATK